MRARFSLTASATAWAPWSWSRLAVRLGRGERASEPEPAAAPVLAPLSPAPPQGCVLSTGIAGLRLSGHLNVLPGATPATCPGGGQGQALLGEPPSLVTCQEVAELPGDSLTPGPCAGTPPPKPCSYIVAGVRDQGRGTVTTHSILGYFAASEGDLCQGHCQASQPPPQPHPSPRGPPVSSQLRVGRAPGGIREP